MLLKRLTEKRAGRKGSGKPAKIKTYAGSYSHPFPAAGSSAVGRGYDDPALPSYEPGPETEIDAAPASPSAAVQAQDSPHDSMELQDTLWTEDLFTIRFLNEDGTLLQSLEASYGEKPSYSGPTPAMPGDGRYRYTFAGWQPAVGRAVADADYTAVFTREAVPGEGVGFAPVFTLLSGPESVSDPEYDPGSYAGAGPDPAGSAPELLLPRAENAGKSALSVSWQPIRNADGYDVVFSRAGSEGKSLCRTCGPDETSAVLKHLEKKAVYKIRVKAYTLAGGKKEYSAKSYPLFCMTGGSGGKYTNARKIETVGTALKVAEGNKETVRFRITGQSADKPVLSKGGALRYFSDCPAVASVSKSGKIKGLRAGRCRIYLVALNGVYASVDVTVSPSSESLSFKKETYGLKPGDKINLAKKLRNVPEKKKGSLVWKSSDSTIAKVSRKGILKARKHGTVSVSAGFPGGPRCEVRVRVRKGKQAGDSPWKSGGGIKHEPGSNITYIA